MPAPAAPWSIAYHDGSANAYRITDDGSGARLVYSPITPAQSSTGTYSGGEPRDERLSTAGAAQLWERVLAFEADRAQHTPDRNKGTGAFTVTDARGTRSWIVEMSQAIRDFDAFLKALT